MRRYRLLLGSLTGLVMMSLIWAGCGKKVDPVPPQIKLPVITDLGTRSIGEGIVLSWSLAGPADGIDRFKILRSVTAEGSQACPGCPQDYRPFVTVELSDDRLKRAGEKSFQYVDTDVRVGGFYAYRIAVCNRGGNCGEASNESGIIHAGR
ncbi:MAG: hypothetical protein ACYDAA_07765 [Syntrophales bacterium]